MNILLAILLGLLFGFVLQKVGAANPQRIIEMLRFRDLHLMKSILAAIGLSNLLLFVMLDLSWINTAHFSIKSAYFGVIIGGGILGLGWSIAGYCPGTGLVAMGAGRKDAVFFVLGGLIGALLYTLVYSLLEPTILFSDIAGKTTLALTNADKYPSLFDSNALMISGSIGLILILVALLLPATRQSQVS